MSSLQSSANIVYIQPYADFLVYRKVIVVGLSVSEWVNVGTRFLANSKCFWCQTCYEWQDPWPPCTEYLMGSFDQQWGYNGYKYLIVVISTPCRLHLLGGYSQSKWVSEQLVLQAIQRGLVAGKSECLQVGYICVWYYSYILLLLSNPMQARFDRPPLHQWPCQQQGLGVLASEGRG